MVTLPEAVEPPPSEREEIVRTVIAGHPQGAIRRGILYIVMFAAMGLAFYVPPFIVVALVAGTLLATTDQLL